MRLPRSEVEGHRRLHRSARALALKSSTRSSGIGRQLDAARLADRGHLVVGGRPSAAACRDRRAACRSAGGSRAIRLALVASRMNFIQSSVTIWSLSTPSKPALLAHRQQRLAARAAAAVEARRTACAMKVPTWRITPGVDDRGADVGHAAHHRPARRGSGSAASGASMPFCSGITAVSGPTSGLMCSPAPSTSHSFTQNSTIVDRADRPRDRRSPGSALRWVRRARPRSWRPCVLHRREMRAARDEGDVRARLGQRRAISTPDAARAHHRDAHELFTLPSKQDAAAPTVIIVGPGRVDPQGMIDGQTMRRAIDVLRRGTCAA